MLDKSDSVVDMIGPLHVHAYELLSFVLLFAVAPSVLGLLARFSRGGF